MGRVGPVRPSLETMARNGSWPTPDARLGDPKRGMPSPRLAEDRYFRKGTRDLMDAVTLWPTPRAHDARADFAKLVRSSTGISLETAARLWPTPTANDWKNAGYMISGGKKYATLPGAAGATPEQWPSPAARDWRSGRGRSPNGHTEQLAEKVGGQLNPVWVEWLMGYPAGWTDLGDSATPSCRQSRRSSAGR